MICQQCGKELPEGTVFCDGCGAQQAAPVAPVAPEAPVVAPAKGGKGKLIGIVVGAVAVVAAVVIVLILLLGGGSVGEAKKFVKYDATDNFEAMFKMAPQFAIDMAFEKADVENMSDFVDEYLGLEMMKEYDEEDAAEKVTYKEAEVIEVYDEDEIEEFIKENAGEGKPFKKSDLSEIDEIVIVEVIYFEDGDRGTVPITMIKVGGKWCSWSATQQVVSIGTMIEMENKK